MDNLGSEQLLLGTDQVLDFRALPALFSSLSAHNKAIALNGEGLCARDQPNDVSLEEFEHDPTLVKLLQIYQRARGQLEAGEAKLSGFTRLLRSLRVLETELLQQISPQSSSSQAVRRRESELEAQRSVFGGLQELLTLSAEALPRLVQERVQELTTLLNDPVVLATNDVPRITTVLTAVKQSLETVGRNFPSEKQGLQSQFTGRLTDWVQDVQFLARLLLSSTESRGIVKVISAPILLSELREMALKTGENNLFIARCDMLDLLLELNDVPAAVSFTRLLLEQETKRSEADMAESAQLAVVHQLHELQHENVSQLINRVLAELTTVTTGISPQLEHLLSDLVVMANATLPPGLLPSLMYVQEHLNLLSDPAVTANKQKQSLRAAAAALRGYICFM